MNTSILRSRLPPDKINEAKITEIQLKKTKDGDSSDLEDEDDQTNDSHSNESNIFTIRETNLWSNSFSFSSFSPKNTKNVNKSLSHVNNTQINKRILNSFRQYVDEEENFTEDEILPDRIEGCYVYDYNILFIDDILRRKFSQDKKNRLGILKNKLELEKNKILKRQNMIERKKSRKKIMEYEEEIFKYENNTDLINYENKTNNLLQEYRKIGVISTVVSFVSNKKDEIAIAENDAIQGKRHQIISEYLEIARKYIQVDLVRSLPNDNSCPGCGTKYEEIELIEDESGSTICPICSLEKISVIKNLFFSDGSRVNNSKNNYEDRVNFEKVLMRYQGKQITKPGKELYEKINEYFISKGLPSSEEYRDMPLLPDGTKEGTSKELMFEALANINCSGYYDDINLICNVFFGWTLPDVTHLEDDIMKDYDSFQKVYDSLPDREGRKSSLNSQWKLYILLKRRQWPCKSRDFKIPSTPHILEYHKVITKQAYAALSWDYNI
jgi:hypothetical protein